MPDPTTADTADATAAPAKPYFQYETRHFRDSDGRRIEMRTLLPGCEDPGPEVFQEFTGIFTVNLVIAGINNPAPVRFNIPGITSVMDAFKVFDALASNAAKEAKENLESKLRRAQLTAGANAGMAAGLVGEDGRPLVSLG